MCNRQLLSALSNFVFIGSYDLTSWLWLASVSTPVCTHTVHTHAHTDPQARSNKPFALLPALSCLAGIISSYSAKGSKVTTVWQHKLHFLPLFCGYVCVYGCCQRHTMTSSIKFALLEVSSVYIDNIIILYILYCFRSSPLLASSFFLPLQLASLLLLFFWPPPPDTFCLLPSLCSLGTHWQDWVTWIVHSSQWEPYCVSVQPTESCTVRVQANREQQYLIPAVCHCKCHYVYGIKLWLLDWNIYLNSYFLENENSLRENNFGYGFYAVLTEQSLYQMHIGIGRIVSFLSSLHISWVKNLRDLL